MSIRSYHALLPQPCTDRLFEFRSLVGILFSFPISSRHDSRYPKKYLEPSVHFLCMKYSGKNLYQFLSSVTCMYILLRGPKITTDDWRELFATHKFAISAVILIFRSFKFRQVCYMITDRRTFYSLQLYKGNRQNKYIQFLLCAS